MKMVRDRPADLVDEEFEEDKVTDAMAAVGGLVLRQFTNDVGMNGAVAAAKAIFCAMRAAEARSQMPAQRLGAQSAKSLRQDD